MKSVLQASIVSLIAVSILPIDAGSAGPAMQKDLDASYNRGYEYGAAITACMNYERGFCRKRAFCWCCLGQLA